MRVRIHAPQHFLPSAIALSLRPRARPSLLLRTLHRKDLMQAPLTGELAWYATGRFYANAQGALFDVGYFLRLPGVGTGLFAGAPSEATACFTFAAQPFSAVHVTNGNLTLGMDAVGDFTIYLNREPCGNFDQLETFSAGEPIATLRRVGVVSGVTVNKEKNHMSRGQLTTNVFSATIIASREFEFGGRRYDLAQLLPHGVTQWGIASAEPVPAPAPYHEAYTFLGSAIAIGA